MKLKFLVLICLGSRVLMGQPAIQVSGAGQIQGDIHLAVLLGTNAPVVSGQLQWVKSAAGTTTFTANSAGVAVDSLGNILSVGTFSRSVDFGSGLITSSNNSADAFLAKYNNLGVLQWVKPFGNTGADAGSGVAVDSANNVIICGAYHSSVSFDGTIITNAGGYDIFVAKYSSAGALVWVKGFGGFWDDVGRSVAVGSGDNIYLTTRFQSCDANFGGIHLTNCTQYYDLAFVKLASNGSTTWARKFGGTNDDIPLGMSLDGSGNMWVVGQYTTSTDLGGGVQASGPGIPDCFIAKYSSANGDWMASRVLGSATASSGQGIALDPVTGNLIVTGAFRGTSNFGNGAVASGNGGGGTIFIASYTVGNSNIWVQKWGGDTSASSDSGYAVSVDSTGILGLTGTSDSGLNFGGGWLTGKGYYTASFQLTGNAIPVHRWSFRSPTIANGIGYGCTFDGFGHYLTSGQFNYTTDFGGIAITIPVGQTGAFVAQYNK